ncbi:Cytosol aminopeptidase family, catalytic domain containing family [Theileria equi strain WA]|uniref:Cytosol aminopeptidase family, catalytic domain containing family n=1 Tax=Theileria equi strain WA TaxID=1537102 RepID=L1LCJ2_THEEQ|nr:Cytosol aminopeptidase family, catalytic domain containing family [Theileria equi strain WA]EKX73061.1 Cytosol aminopeptidase family, catalytic domain containing family [Theileria equi strain WA]|eukprot:XP_004832513.1 Cytosol aminopeptidase family, catalytic domain containing family [Theileria equi strain WA]
MAKEEERRDGLFFDSLTYFLVGLSVALIYSFADNDHFMFYKVFREAGIHVDFPHYYTRQLVVFWGFVASFTFMFVGVFNKKICTFVGWLVPLSYLYIISKVTEYGSVKFGTGMLRAIAVTSIVSHIFQTCFVFQIFEETEGLFQRLLSFVGGYFLGYPVVTRLLLRRVLVDGMMDSASIGDDLFHFCTTLFFITFTMAACLTYLFYGMTGGMNTHYWLPAFSPSMGDKISLGTCVYLWILNPVCISILPQTLMEQSEYHNHVFIQRVTFAIALLAIPSVVGSMDVSMRCILTLWKKRTLRYLEGLKAAIMVSEELNEMVEEDGREESPLSIVYNSSDIKVPSHIDTWSSINCDSFSDWEHRDVETRDSILSAILILDLLIKLENTLELGLVEDILKLYCSSKTKDPLVTCTVLLTDNKQVLLTVLSRSMGMSKGLLTQVEKIPNCYNGGFGDSTKRCCFKKGVCKGTSLAGTTSNEGTENKTCDCCCPVSIAEIRDFVRESVSSTEDSICTMVTRINADTILSSMEASDLTLDSAKVCVAVLKAYYQSCIWLLISILCIEEAILLAVWFCKLCELCKNICKIIDEKTPKCQCINKSKEGTAVTIKTCSVTTLENFDDCDCLCIVSYYGIRTSVETIMTRLHCLRTELVTRANTTCTFQKVETSDLASEAYLLDSIKAAIILFFGLDSVYKFIVETFKDACWCCHKDKDPLYPAILSCLLVCYRLCSRLFRDASEGTKILEDALLWYKCIFAAKKSSIANVPTKNVENKVEEVKGDKEVKTEDCEGGAVAKTRNLKLTITSFETFVKSAQTSLSYFYRTNNRDGEGYAVYYAINVDKTKKAVKYLSRLAMTDQKNYTLSSKNLVLREGMSKSGFSSGSCVNIIEDKAKLEDQKKESPCKCFSSEGEDICASCEKGEQCNGCKNCECKCKCPENEGCPCGKTQDKSCKDNVFTRLSQIIECKCGTEEKEKKCSNCFNKLCSSLSNLTNKISEVSGSKKEEEKKECEHPGKCGGICCQTRRFSHFLKTYVISVFRDIYKELNCKEIKCKCCPCCKKNGELFKCKCQCKEDKKEKECGCKCNCSDTEGCSSEGAECKCECRCELCWKNFFRCFVICGLKCGDQCKSEGKGCCKCCCTKTGQEQCKCENSHKDDGKCTHKCENCLLCLYTTNMFFCSKCCSQQSETECKKSAISCKCTCGTGTDKCCCKEIAEDKKKEGELASLKLDCCCGDRLGCSIDKITCLLKCFETELPGLYCLASKLDCQLFQFCEQLCSVLDTLEDVKFVLEKAIKIVECRITKVKCMIKCYSAKFKSLKEQIESIDKKDEMYPQVVDLVKKTGKFAVLVTSYSPEIEATYMKTDFHSELLKSTTQNLAEVAMRVEDTSQLAASTGRSRVALLADSKTVQVDAPNKSEKDNSSILKEYIFIVCRIIFLLLRFQILDPNRLWLVKVFTVAFSILSAVYLNLFITELSSDLGKHTGYSINLILLCGVGTNFIYSWLFHLFDYVSIVYPFGNIVSKLETSNPSVDYGKSRYSMFISLISSLRTEFNSIFGIFSDLDTTSSYSGIRQNVYPFSTMSKSLISSFRGTLDFTPILNGPNRSVSAIMDHISFTLLGCHSDDLLTKSSGYFGDLNREMLWHSWYANTVITDTTLFYYYLRRSILFEMSEIARLRPVDKPFSRGFTNSRQLWKHFGKIQVDLSFNASLKSPEIEIPRSRHQLNLLRERLYQEYRQKWLVYQLRATKSLVNVPLDEHSSTEDLPFLYIKELDTVHLTANSLDKLDKKYSDVYRGTKINNCKVLKKEIKTWRSSKLGFCETLSDEGECKRAVNTAVKSLERFFDTCEDHKPVKDMIEYITSTDYYSTYTHGDSDLDTDHKMALFDLTFHQDGLENNYRIFKGFKNSISHTLDHQLEIAKRNKTTSLIPLGIYTLHYGLQISHNTLEQIEKGLALEFKVLEKDECEELGMGAYLAVSQGSVHPPKFLHATYKSDGDIKKKIAFVGKGIMFDAGGYNVKNATTMIHLMKLDMGGMATVFGAAEAIAKLKPKHVEVHFISATCENMVDANSYRPGDIVTASNGKTIEVINTDCEGRMTLADALCYAESLGVDVVLDTATLTGAQIVALGGDNVQQDENGYFYNSDDGQVNLTEDWYPDPEGIYRKFTHTPKGGSIKEILHKGSALSGINLSSHTSVSVYYWTLDTDYSQPLLIQLGEGINEYYIRSNDDNWTKYHDSNSLQKDLDKQNCTRNRAHIVLISDKSDGYQCPGCDTQKINVLTSSPSGYNSHRHSIGYSSSISVTTFKDDKNGQVGLPPVKDAQYVIVYRRKSGDTNPLLIYYKQDEEKWFRRNTSDGNTWSEVSKDKKPTNPNEDTDGKIKDLLQLSEYHPQITLDLSTSATNYSDSNTGIHITVRSSPVEGGYSEFEHSLFGGLFTVKSVMHGTTPLTGITSDGQLDSVTAYYYGDHPSEEKRLLLVELRSRGGIKYQYFHRETKDAKDWKEYSISDQESTRLQGKYLKTELDKLKKVQFPSGKSTLRKVLEGCGETGAAGGVGAEAYNFFFNPDKSATRQIIRLLTRLL